MDKKILLKRNETDDGGWAEVVLNRPEKGNALTLEMLNELERITEDLRSDGGLRVVVLRGEGRFFCTGGDINEWSAMSPSQMAEEWILRGIEVFGRIAALPQPVIAVLNGHALGGGLELALAADIRIAAAGAKLGVPEVRLGMISGWGGVRRLAETIGVSRARMMTLTGEPVTAATALDFGLVHFVEESESDVEARVERLIRQFFSNGPIAMRVTKGLLATAHEDLRFAHATAVAQVAATEDCKEGVEAFREKRQARFKNQ